MFIELDNKYIINTNFIEAFDKNRLYLTAGRDDYVKITSNDYKKLKDALLEEEYVPTITGPTQHKPSELGEFLTKLHNLLGGRGEAKLTTDRKARLATRLKDFSREEMVLAATNLGNDEFMQGGNDNGKRYGTIDYLLRTSANVNKYLEEQVEKKKPGMF